MPNEPPKKVFKCIGMNVSRAKIEDGKLWVQGRELTYYLDPTTGEKLTRWDNPWTGEKDLPGIKKKDILFFFFFEGLILYFFYSCPYRK